VLESFLFVYSDKSLIKYKSSPEMEPVKVDGGLYWKQENPIINRWEPLRQAVPDFLPTVYVCSSSNSWESETKDYLETIHDRLQLPDEQKTFARKLVSKISDESAKVAAIASYVQTTYSYKALEFGRRARIPQKTSDIVLNKYGDCKDHALLLQQMLLAVDIPAELALVSFNRAVETEIPSLDQFNHMIVYLPSFRNGCFIDCTSKGDDLSEGEPIGLAGQPALILDEKRPRFVSIPPRAADASRMVSHRDLEIVNQTDLHIREDLSLFGCHAAYMRNFLKNVPSGMRKASLLQQLNDRALHMEKLEIENLDENSLPLILHASYLIKRHFQKVNTQVFGTLPAVWEHYFLAAEPQENRITPFEVAVPFTFESDVNLRFPDKWKLLNRETLSLDSQRSFISFKSNARELNGHLHVHSRVKQVAGKFPAKQYSEYCDQLTKTITALEQNIIFSPAKSISAIELIK
jgi:hypothetical protein